MIFLYRRISDRPPFDTLLTFFSVTILLLGAIVVPLHGSPSNSQILEKGIEYYENRAHDAGGTVASSEPINQAINHLERALTTASTEKRKRQAVEYLLKSYYYKGTYVPLPQNSKKEIFAKAKQLGLQMVKKYPESVPIIYGYVINVSRWGKVHGIPAAVRKGIPGVMREHVRTMLELDPDYANAAPHRILGYIHHKAPYIPLVLSWPSPEKALKHLKEAIDRAPNELLNRYYYAVVLVETDRPDQALEQLNALQKLDTRPESAVEDRRTLKRAQQLRQKLLEK